MNKITQIHARPQRRRALEQPITVSQWLEIKAALRELPALIASATALEFRRQGLVPSASLPPMPVPQWRDDCDPF